MMDLERRISEGDVQGRRLATSHAFSFSDDGPDSRTPFVYF